MENDIQTFLWFKTLSGALMGSVFGSFITMLSYRLPRHLSIIDPPSTCPSCQKRLGFRDLIPLFSWIYARGKCRHCGMKIGARYVLIELFSTCLITASFIIIGFSWLLLPFIALVISGMTAAIIKIES